MFHTSLFQTNEIPKTSPFKIAVQKIKFYSIRSFCSSKPEDKLNISKDLKNPNCNINWKPIYLMPKINVVRLIHRLKLYQSVFTVAILPMTLGFYCFGKASTTTALVVTGVASFTSVSLYIFSSFFKRIIGIIFIDEDKRNLKIAHLTFWGKRKDIIVPIDEIIPLTDYDNNPFDVFVKLRRTSSEETLYVTLRFGKIINEATFKEIFGNIEIPKSKK